MATLVERDSLVGMVLGPIVWAVHFLGVYVFTAVACAFRFAHVEFLGISVVNSAMLVFTAVLLAVLGFLSWLAWRRFRQAGGPSEPKDPQSSRHQFMSLSALLLCGLSAVAVVYQGIPLLILEACG